MKPDTRPLAPQELLEHLGQVRQHRPIHHRHESCIFEELDELRFRNVLIKGWVGVQALGGNGPLNTVIPDAAMISFESGSTLTAMRTSGSA